MAEYDLFYETRCVNCGEYVAVLKKDVDWDNPRCLCRHCHKNIFQLEADKRYAGLGSTSNPEYTKAGVTLIALGLALLIAPILVFFPGCLLMMAFKWGSNYESGWLFWMGSIALSGLIFLFCGVDWKKYAGFVVSLMIIVGICAWIIASFTPFSYIWANLYRSFPSY